ENASKNVVARAGDRVNVALNLRAIPKPVPAIASFAADSLNLQAGQSTTLKWEAQQAIEVSLDGESISGARGSWSVSPGATTKYTLIAKSAAGTKTQEVPVLVEAPKAAEAKPAAPAPSTAGGSEDVVLIKDLLEHRWKSAYESSNVAAARAIWPTMSKDLQNA